MYSNNSLWRLNGQTVKTAVLNRMVRWFKFCFYFLGGNTDQRKEHSIIPPTNNSKKHEFHTNAIPTVPLPYDITST